ncbi:unnamed protein product [Paramecium sonneborni]|uniref:Uncharacterized protein n=1 Tax=Paramecium sonneborni TaxID=65129 RepID=A0A8S1RNX1_9CILI|nr:unnamed protein product [Paramecium sonneborni]
MSKSNSPLDQQFMQYRFTIEIAERMYIPSDEMEQIVAKEKLEADDMNNTYTMVKQQQQNAPKDPKAKPTVPPPINILNQAVFEKDTIITIEDLSTLLRQTQQKLFDYITSCLNFQNEQANESDKEFIKQSENSKNNKHAQIGPQKQDIKNKITIHKKVERIDDQTEQINLLQEGGLLDMKDYIQEYQTLKNNLQSATTLVKLQGIQNTVKENYFNFGEKINDLEKKLSYFANQELDVLLQKNNDFMRDCKPNENFREELE